ncbi:hypothetical protein GCM10009425_28180 [Pseudomonas asuensis]|uniref:Uncharacterized protein n=1 Tax=Pseudomonas asuensis TaxID=1825787 RepID=A0ABQ2GWT3_9PSED|nr:hypothetical protein GCM10009425_28180 [Pseudomonas asuensis]
MPVGTELDMANAGPAVASRLARNRNDIFEHMVMNSNPINVATKWPMCRCIREQGQGKCAGIGTNVWHGKVRALKEH